MGRSLQAVNMASRIGKVAVKSSALFLCDMQEQFRKTIQYYPQIIEVSSRMLQAAKVLEMPVVVTEQYPKGLGPTVSELDVQGCPVFPKTQFSMCIDGVQEHLKTLPDLKSVILCGIECHACIQQTTLDLKEQGFDVHVVADAVSSRSMVDRMYGLQRLREAGAYISTSESMILMLARDAKHPRFKELQKIIWDSAPDSGLLGSSSL